MRDCPKNRHQSIYVCTYCMYKVVFYMALRLTQTVVPPQTIGCNSFTEDALLRHAQFVVEQV